MRWRYGCGDSKFHIRPQITEFTFTTIQLTSSYAHSSLTQLNQALPPTAEPLPTKKENSKFHLCYYEQQDASFHAVC